MRTHVRRAPVEETIEDVEWLVGTDSPENIAARVGKTLDALEKFLRRAGRDDLWNQMQRDSLTIVRTHVRA